MRCVLIMMVLGSCFCLQSVVAEEQSSIQIDVTESEGAINPLIYGQFLEHIAHSTDLGLHAEMLTERSFEYRGVPYDLPAYDGITLQGNMWEEADGKATSSLVSGAAAMVIDSDATNYVLEARVRKTYKSGTIWVLFRQTNPFEGYMWNVTGDGNGKSLLSARRHHMTTDLSEAPVSYTTGDWLDVRVEVAGDHIVCQLNGQVIHNIHDKRHPEGNAGVAFMVAPGEIDSLRLSTLDGKTLCEPAFSEEPAKVHWNDVGRRWEAVNLDRKTATALRVTDNPLNSQYALRLELSEPAEPAGLRQLLVPTQKGKTYQGYIYVRAEDFSGKACVVWQNNDGTQTYAEQPLTVEGSDWHKVAFRLKPNTTDPAASIAFLFEGTGTVWLDQASLMPSDLKAPPFRTDLLEALKALKPTIIRYPGGCFASIYDWRDGVGPIDERPVMPVFDWESVGGVDPNHFGTDEYMALCRETGAAPMLTTNLSLGPEVAAQWVEYCNGDVTTPMGALRAKNGHPEPYNVKYWSIDNEYWIVSGKNYGQLARVAAEAMLKVDPDLKFWLVGSQPGLDDFIDGVLEEAGQYCDYLSIHNYGHGGYDEVLASNLKMEDWFASLEQRIKRLVPDRHIQLAFDEWNSGQNQLYFGIASAGWLNSMERYNHIVGMSSPALLMRHAVLASAWNNALIHFDHTRMHVNGTYLAMKMYADNYAPERVAATVTSDGYALEGRDEPVPYLDAVATCDREDGRVVLKVLNRYKTEAIDAVIQLELPEGASLKKKVMVSTLNADDVNRLNTFDEPNHMRIEHDTLKVRGNRFNYSFPAHSATVLVMHAPSSALNIK